MLRSCLFGLQSELKMNLKILWRIDEPHYTWALVIIHQSHSFQRIVLQQKLLAYLEEKCNGLNVFPSGAKGN